MLYIYARKRCAGCYDCKAQASKYTFDCIKYSIFLCQIQGIFCFLLQTSKIYAIMLKTLPSF